MRFRQIELVRCVAVFALSLAGLKAQDDAALPYMFTTYAGKAGEFGSVNGALVDARFRTPGGLAMDDAGNLYVADSADHTIRKISAAGVVTTVAGISGQTGVDDGPAASARFGAPPGQFGGTTNTATGPHGIAVGKDGALYVTEARNHTIRKISASGIVSTLAGRPQISGANNGVSAGATFNTPVGIAVDAAGVVYVAEMDNQLLRVISPLGYVGTLAGSLNVAQSVDQNFGETTARFAYPAALAWDSGGRIFVGSARWLVRRISLSPTPVTVANGALQVTGPKVETLFNQTRPYGISGMAVAANGTVFFTEGSMIRQITPDGQIATIGGWDGSDGAVDGFAVEARFKVPDGIVVDGAGTLYIADSGNGTIRRATKGAYAKFQTQPKGGTVNPGQSFSFTVTATGNPAPTYQWSKNGNPIAGATSTTLTVASAKDQDAGLYTVAIKNVFGTFSSSDAALVVASVPIVTSRPVEQTVSAGQSVTLSVTATGAVSYQWQKNGVAIAGATGATYTIPVVQRADAGAYAVIVANALGAVTTPEVTVTVNTGRIINLSILTTVAAGGDSFTMGYVVGGNGTSGAKPLVIRAAGPSLGALGVPATLDDPKLELYAGATKSGENDNWGGSAQLTAALSAVGAFAYTGPASKDAAALANITSRDNSVVVSAADRGAGQVIAEIYDATPAASFVATTPRLVNVSVRKELGTGLTMGFVVGGSAPTKVLIRAVGPTLGVFGVPGVVADPQLTLFNDKSAKIGENNDWGGTAELTAAFGAVGAFALGATSKDAALLVTLAPGNYSVQVAGVANTTGVALVEVYEVP